MASWRRGAHFLIAALIARAEVSDLSSALDADDCSDATCALSALQARARSTQLEKEEPEVFGDDDEGDKYDELVQQPLTTASQMIRTAVEKDFLPRIIKALKAKDFDPSELRQIGVDIRELVAVAVPKLLAARDNSSAYDLDPRVDDTSRAVGLQLNMNKMQLYSAMAWPVIIKQAQTAFGDGGRTPEVVQGVHNGIQEWKAFLAPIMKENWQITKIQFANIKELMQRKTADYSADLAADTEKAGCAANYAKTLGKMTEVFQYLAVASQDCSPNRTSIDLDVQDCAADDVKALQDVATTLEVGADALWQCFGLFWGCCELTNSAFARLMMALSASLVMSSDCNEEGKEICKTYVFQALANLVSGAGRMEEAADQCQLRGSENMNNVPAWNPNAATPAQIKPGVVVKMRTDLQSEV